MIDSELHERIVVHTEGSAGPYIMVPLEQLEEVSILLHQAAIPFSVEEDAISIDGKPEIAIVDFGQHAEVDHIQAILDAHG